MLSLFTTVVALSLLIPAGNTDFQLLIVLSFYVYCFVVLFTFSRDKLFHVLSIPLLTQFLHLFQKYSFPAGANSLWRLAPFLILSFYFVNFFLRKEILLDASDKLLLAAWLITSFFYLAISPNLAGVFVGACLFWLFIIPAFFIYLGLVMQAPDFAAALEKYLFLFYLILGLGTFGLVFTGAMYKGSDNLLATRNISDTNVTMAYFILLLPFAFLYSTRFRSFYSFLIRLSVVAILVAVVIFSFSRGAIFLIFPYLAITFWIVSKRELALVLLLIFISIPFIYLIENESCFQDMSYFWKLRFGNTFTFNNFLETSGRREIQEIAYQLFLQHPLFGHGTGSFEMLGPGYREAHSLWYTLLAENGLFGAFAMYLLLGKTLFQSWGICVRGQKYKILFFSMLFYLLFNHTVGSVFVIIPSKSLTINCIAPILLLCLYSYTKHISSLSEC